MKLSKLVILLTAGFTATLSQATTLSLPELNDLLTHPSRQSNDSARDNARKPAQIMHFSGVSTGDNVLDLFAGGGWYSELFSMAVGPKGKVYAQNDNVIWRFAQKRIQERTKDNRLANITRFDKIDIADISVPNKTIDIAFTALNYHDLFFTHDISDGKKTVFRDTAVDHKAALAKVKSILKDDGVFIIIDHHAPKGSGFDAPNSTHRIDSNIVKYQMAEAGFQLVEVAFYLTNSKDDLTINVFEDSTRGKTDRFIYKFIKM
jgi:predicted methyltransferase